MTPRQLLELLHRLVDFLLDLLSGRPAAGLVLVLLKIHLEFEHFGQIARGAASAAPAAAPHAHLDVGEQVFRPQQELQRLLLRPNRIIEPERLQRLGRGLHEAGSLLQQFGELRELGICPGQLPRSRALHQGLSLLHQRALQLREHLGALAQLALFPAVLGVALLDQVPGRKDDFLLAARDLVLLLALLALAARLLGLREASLERLHVDEVHVAAHFLLGILGNDVVADQVSGDEARLRSRRRERLPALFDGLRRGSRSPAEVFQEECVAAGRLQRAGPGGQRHRLLVHAIDRVVQLQAAQAEIVGRFEPHGDLLDAACAPVAARLEDLDLRLLVRHGRDEVVLGEAHPLPAVHGCHVVGRVLPDDDFRAIAPQRDFLLANH